MLEPTKARSLNRRRTGWIVVLVLGLIGAVFGLYTLLSSVNLSSVLTTLIGTFLSISSLLMIRQLNLKINLGGEGNQSIRTGDNTNSTINQAGRDVNTYNTGMAREPAVLTIEYDPVNNAGLYVDQGQFGTGTRRYMKVRVNNSGGLAEQCKPTLALIGADDHSTRFPRTGIPYELIWESNERTRMNIGAKIGSEPLFVVLSDSFYTSITDPNSGRRDFRGSIATENTMKSQIPNAAHCFGEGTFTVKLLVVSINGESAEATFKVQYTGNWQDLNMTQVI